MRYKFYTISEKAWNAMLAAISRAERSILLEMYIFVDDVATHRFFEVLQAKARSGVKVKLIVDAFGSDALHGDDVAALRQSGVEILFFSYWLRHTHKKILVVDGKRAFLGGVNVKKFFRKWNDLQMEVSGPVVKGVARSFAKSYRDCGGRDPEVLSYLRRKNFLQRARIRLLERQYFALKSPLARHYRDKLSDARGGIIIVTPYFAPRRWFVGVLHQAVLRGVRVEILLPRHTDHKLFDRMNYFFISKLHALGVIFHLHREMNHAKALLVDEREGMVSSHNIDPFSFSLNTEAGVVFTDKKIIRELAGILEGWKENSVIFTPAMYRPQLAERLLAPIVNLLW